MKRRLRDQRTPAPDPALYRGARPRGLYRRPAGATRRGAGVFAPGGPSRPRACKRATLKQCARLLRTFRKILVLNLRQAETILF